MSYCLIALLYIFCCHCVAQFEDAYDYVIIGGGTAGCIVAARLSEDLSVSVLVVEEGDFHHQEDLTTAPGLFLQITLDKERNRFYESDPEGGLQNATRTSSQGKMVGGSMEHNFLQAVRGNKLDYDEWDELLGGNSGWSWEDVLPFFQGIETSWHRPSPDRGGYGPIHVSEANFFSPEDTWYIRAAHELGLEFRHDYNDGIQTGASFFEWFIGYGQRSSTVRDYLLPAMDQRTNIDVMTNTIGKRLIFSDDNPSTLKTVTGVEVQSVVDSELVGEPRIISCKKEVVVSAGALRSPLVLLNSGIGDEQYLSDMGIAVELNLPGVGENLHTHPIVQTVHFIPSAKTDWTVEDAENQWSQWKSGPWTIGPGRTVIFHRSSVARDERPDLEAILVTPYSESSAPWNYSPNVGHFLNRPLSRGYVKLNPDDQFLTPKYKFNLLNDEDGHDIAGLIEAVQWAHGLYSTETMTNLNAQPYIYPDDISSVDSIEGFIRATAFPSGHVSGSNKMGLGRDMVAVVDERLKVHGTTNLRVIDASIMPVLGTGNPCFSIMMIAEKGAKMMQEDTSGIPPHAQSCCFGGDRFETCENISTQGPCERWRVCHWRCD